MICKSYSHFFSKKFSVYAVFNGQSFNHTLTNDIVRFEQLGPESGLSKQCRLRSDAADHTV